jgi:hypothetical protein
MTVLYARKGAEPRKLHCPICRSDRVKVGALERVFPRPAPGAGCAGARGAWRAVQRHPRRPPQAAGGERDRVALQGADLLPRVPVFMSAAATWPALPVMPEYLDCLDPAQVRLAREQPERFGRVVQERGKARYQCVLPLRGLKPTEWPTYECDLLAANPFSSNAGRRRRGRLPRRLAARVAQPQAPHPRVALLRRPRPGAHRRGHEPLRPGADGARADARPPSDADGRPVSETQLERIPLDQEVGREGDGGPRASSAPRARGRPRG